MTGQRVLVLSLCTPRGYDTGATTDPRWQAVWLKKEKGPFVPVFRSEIETRIDERCDTSRVDSFFNGFCDGDILSMQQWDCIWEMLPAQYILVSRIRHGSSIRGFDAGKKRKIHIESEVWNTRERVVVWRCNVRGMNTGGRMDETRFVRNALLSGLRLLPPLLPAVNENVW